jgi:hypothetical protein
VHLGEIGVMQTEMKREIPSAVRKLPMINLGHIPQALILWGALSFS